MLWHSLEVPHQPLCVILCHLPEEGDRGDDEGEIEEDEERVNNSRNTFTPPRSAPARPGLPFPHLLQVQLAIIPY